MRAVAILPVKRFSRAKQRLALGLSERARQALAEAMIGDVMEAIAAVRELEAVIVVSGDPSARELAAAAGFELVDDARDQGQSTAAIVGLRRAVKLGFDTALLVPGDCPAIDPAEATGLLAAAPDPPSVVVVPDRHGTGTNALVLRPLEAIVPAFGPGSRARHEALAAESGVTCVVRSAPSLALDVDTPDDLDALRAALTAHPADRAPRTRAALAAVASGEAA